VDGNELANVVALADLNRCRFAAVFQVLGSKADGNKWEDTGFITDARFAVDNHMRFQTNAVPQNDLIADHAESSDIMIGSYLSLFADDSTFMNKGGHAPGRELFGLSRP